MDIELVKQMIASAVQWAEEMMLPSNELRFEIKEEAYLGRYTVYILHNGDVVEEQIYEILHKL